MKVHVFILDSLLNSSIPTKYKMNAVIRNEIIVTIMSVLLILCAFCISTACSLRAAPIYKLEDAEIHFETFIQKNNKVYADENEKKARFEIFKVNLEEVNRLNDGQDDAVFGNANFKTLIIPVYNTKHV